MAAVMTMTMPPPPPQSGYNAGVTPLAPPLPPPPPAVGGRVTGKDQPLVASGPCRIERVQAAFDVLLEPAVALHNEDAGKEGVRRGLQSLYYKLGSGELNGAVQEKLLRLVAAVEVRDIPAANKAREEIIRTTTTGWVEGGTWQWALKHLVEASKDVPAADVGSVMVNSSDSNPIDQEISPEVSNLISALESRLEDARKSTDAKRCDDFAKRLESLYAALRNGSVNANTLAQLVAVVTAVEEKDTKSVQKCFQDIAKTDFELSKTWLPALKQMFR